MVARSTETNSFQRQTYDMGVGISRKDKANCAGSACLIPESYFVYRIAIDEILRARHVKRIVEQGLVVFTRGWKLNFSLSGPREVQDEDAPNTGSSENCSDWQLVLRHTRMARVSWQLSLAKTRLGKPEQCQQNIRETRLTRYDWTPEPSAAYTPTATVIKFQTVIIPTSSYPSRRKYSTRPQPT